MKIAPAENQNFYHLVAPMQSLRIGTGTQRTTGAPFVAAITLYGSLLLGTGGIIANTNVSNLNAWGAWPVVELRPTSSPNSARSKSSLKVTSVADQLRLVRDGFGLTMTDVARIFGVSRQAAYSWLGGVIPRPEVARRISNLNRSILEVNRIFSGEFSQLLHRPLLHNGGTLFDVLLSGDDLDEVLGEIGRTASEEAQLRAESLTRNVGASNGIDSSFLELAKPVLDEQNR